MYDIIGLLKLLTKPVNYTITLVLFLNTSVGILLPFLQGNTPNLTNWSISIAALLISVMLVTMKWFNKLIFTLFRIKGKCSKVDKSSYHERLSPIFADAVQRSRAVAPNIREDIEFYIVENDELVGVKSSGSNIIHITTAAADQLTDEELGAMLARECGHIGNRDFELKTLLFLSGIPNVVIVLCWKIQDLILKLIKNVFRGGLESLACDIVRIMAFVMFLPIFLWMILIVAINLSSFQQKEMDADTFSVCLGYANELESALKKIYSDKISLIDRFFGGIPSLEKRLKNIENIVNSTTTTK